MSERDRVPDVVMTERVGRLLMLRRTVPSLFRKIATLQVPHVIVDFAGVEFMSAAFAEEYLSERRRCKTRIEERHVPPEVESMLAAVARRSAKSGSRAPVARHLRPLRTLEARTL